MSARIAFIVAAGLVATAQQAPPSPKLASLLDGDGTAALRLEAPLQQLFAKGSEDENVSVPGTVAFRDPRSGRDVVLSDVEVSVRGHTSRRETECTFPKLKLKLKGAGSIKIGTHCGESPDAQLTEKYGRLANERSPLREALAYQMIAAAGVPALRARPARVTYVDPAAAPLTRNALVVEEDDAAMRRTEGAAELTMETFGSVAARKAAADAGLIAFGEAMIGNFDWCVRFAPGDPYRCDDTKPLWNVLAFENAGGTRLVMKDLDLAGVVVGRHSWFDSVWNPAFVPSKSPVSIEVLSQVQRTRTLFGRADLDRLRRHFLERRGAVLDVIGRASVDEAGREVARSYAEAFFAAIADDEGFYRPVVSRSDVQVYLDADRTKEACGPKDLIPQGTPVNVVRQAGSMSQVVILDALWRWASKNHCDSVRNGPVWMLSDAITTDFPPKSPSQ